MKVWFVLFVAALLSQPLLAADGAALYAQNCAARHGDQGSGGIGVPLAMASANGLMSDDYLRKTIRHGRPGRVMPTFATLGDLDVEAIVRSFQSEPVSGSATLLAVEQPAIVVESPYDLPTTVTRLKQEIGGNNFVFIREQKLDDGLVLAGQEDPRRHSVSFFNFGLLSEPLRTDPRVGLFLPSRITVVEQGGKVRMMAANPQRLSQLFNHSELNRMCDEMSRMYRTLMDDATL